MSYKSPTDPSNAPDYRLWRKDALIWQKLTDVPKAKQGLSLQYACKANARIHEAVVDIESEQVECEDGFKNVLEVLDKLFKVDVKEEEMKAYHLFETISRRDDQTVADFIIEFDALLKKTQSHGNVMSKNLLAVKLMRAANLTKSQCEIIKASTAVIDYDSIKATMKRTFGESTGLGGSSTDDVTQGIKIEPTFQSSHGVSASNCACQKSCQEGHQSREEEKEEMFYGNYSKGKYSSRFQNQKETASKYQKETVPGTKYLQGRNPLDPQGRLTRCSVCDSVNHWKNNCPDRDLFKCKSTYFNVVLFQADLDEPHRIDSLVHETLGAGVADCGASSTCCGRKWFSQHIELLTPEDRGLITYEPSNRSYKFGHGPAEKASTMVRFPIYLGSKKVFLEADVLEHDLPLLLSKATLKRAHARLNTEDDEITMLGEKIKLINTSTGHYAIPITPNRDLINNLTGEPSADIPDEVVLMSTNPKLTRKEIAVKLHRQFAHPTAEKLNSLVNLSDLKNDVELKKEIKDVTENCTSCKRCKRAPTRPVVALPLSSQFNEMVAMDIKFYQGTPILHLIDTSTRYSVAVALKDHQSKEVVDHIFKHWISIFGRPSKIISNNKEFASEEFKVIAESVGIYVSTTATAGPWSNEICGRYNQVIGDMTDKIRSEVDCSLSVALAWAASAINSLQNVHGFSPSQLVFGFNPMLPSVLTDLPPALSHQRYSDMITKHLNAQKVAFDAFNQAQSSQRIRRALSHNIRSSGDIKYINGDKVFYKKKDDREWHGPGVVIGQDDEFVLIRHQSTWVRVHPDRMQLI